jgi:hypothetical protein
MNGPHQVLWPQLTKVLNFFAYNRLWSICIHGTKNEDFLHTNHTQTEDKLAHAICWNPVKKNTVRTIVENFTLGTYWEQSCYCNIWTQCIGNTFVHRNRKSPSSFAHPSYRLPPPGKSTGPQEEWPQVGCVGVAFLGYFCHHCWHCLPNARD